jgi:hypothetical protein
MRIFDIDKTEITDEDWEKIGKKDWGDKLFPNGIGYYRASHSLTHPWTILEYCWHQVRYAWERVFSYDERIIWSIDAHLSKMMPIWLQQLKKQKQGVPTIMFEDSDWNDEKCEYIDGAMERAEKKYDDILDQIIKGFESYNTLGNKFLSIHDPEYIKLNQDFEIGMQLLTKYFGTLWD